MIEICFKADFMTHHVGSTRRVTDLLVEVSSVVKAFWLSDKVIENTCVDRILDECPDVDIIVSRGVTKGTSLVVPLWYAENGNDMYDRFIAVDSISMAEWAIFQGWNILVGFDDFDVISRLVSRFKDRPERVLMYPQSNMYESFFEGPFSGMNMLRGLFLCRRRIQKMSGAA
jgi:hypothetical protein